MKKIVEIPVTDWSSAGAPAFQESALDALEGGSVLVLPQLPFSLNPAEKTLLTSVEGSAKNISWDAGARRARQRRRHAPRSGGAAGHAEPLRGVDAQPAARLAAGLPRRAASRARPASGRSRSAAARRRGARMTPGCTSTVSRRRRTRASAFCASSPTSIRTAWRACGSWARRSRRWRGASCRRCASRVRLGRADADAEDHQVAPQRLRSLHAASARRHEGRPGLPGRTADDRPCTVSRPARPGSSIRTWCRTRR